MNKFRKIIKDGGILANVKTTSESADLISAFFKEAIELLLQAEQEEHLVLAFGSKYGHNLYQT